MVIALFHGICVIALLIKWWELTVRRAHHSLLLLDFAGLCLTFEILPVIIIIVIMIVIIIVYIEGYMMALCHIIGSTISIWDCAVYGVFHGVIKRIGGEENKDVITDVQLLAVGK